MNETKQNKFDATEIPEWATAGRTPKGRLIAHIQFLCNTLKKERMAKDTYRAKLHRLRRDTKALLILIDELESTDLLLSELSESPVYQKLKQQGALK